MTSNRVLVTGGLGFIGSNLCRRLLSEQSDIELTIIDDLSGTVTDYSDLAPHAEIVIADQRTLNPFTARFDAVYHLASPVGSLGILGRTGQIASDIIDLASHAQSVAANAGASLLYVSSSEVYGRAGKHSEDIDMVVPPRRGARMEYALGKLTAEHVLYNKCAAQEVDLRMIRPFNCSGPGQSPGLGFVVPTFVSAALAGTPLPVHSNGKQRRAFCHVQDLASGILAVQAQGRAGALYNLGQPSGVVTIRGLAEFIVDRLGSKSKIVHIDPTEKFGPTWIEAFDKIPDISRAQAETGWAPLHDLESIVDDVADHLRRPTQGKDTDLTIATLANT